MVEPVAPPPEPLPPSMSAILKQIEALQGEVVGLKAALAAPHPEPVKEDLRAELDAAQEEIKTLKNAVKQTATPAQRKSLMYWAGWGR